MDEQPTARLPRRTALRSGRVVAAAWASTAGGVVTARPAVGAESQRRGIPAGYEQVDPRTARRVPLTMSLRDGVPLYPGDPAFRHRVVVDTRTLAHDDGGFLLERVTSLGTHTASHISAPAHFILGGQTLAGLPEAFTLMPLAVVDIRRRISDDGPHFRVRAEDLRQWESRHGHIPPGGCVVLLTGYAALADVGQGEHSPYVTTPAPGFSGGAVDWLFSHRDVLAVGSDTLGPDATADTTLQASTRALAHGGITVENIGTGLAHMRPHGDWISVNGNRPAFSGFQMGFTGFTVAT